MRCFKYSVLVFIGYLFCSCVTDADQQLPDYFPTIYSEDFQLVVDSTFQENEWRNFATQGTKVWQSKIYKKNGYFEFSPYGSGEVVNEAWLISPKINIDQAKGGFLVFDVAQHHLKNPEENQLQLYVLQNLNGLDIGNAVQIEKKFNLPEKGNENNYKFISSGKVNISEFSGDIQIGFKATGGDGSDVSGAYQIDNIKVF